MSKRIVYGLSQISGNSDAIFPVDVPNGTISSIIGNNITSTTSLIETWESTNFFSVKTADPSFELYTAEKCGFAATSNSLVAISDNEVGLELTQNDTKIDRLWLHSNIIRQYETISVASQNYNISAASPKTYLIEPGSANTNKIIFDDTSLNDGTTYSFYNMSNGPVTVENTIDSSVIKTLTVNQGTTGADLYTGCTTVRMSPVLPNFATGGQNGTIKIWDYPALTENAAYSPTTHGSIVECLAFDPNGVSISYSGASDYSIKNYSLLSNTTTIIPAYSNPGFPNGHNSNVRDLVYSPNGQFLVSCQSQTATFSSWIKVWETNNFTYVKAIGTFSNSTNNSLHALAFTSDGSKLVVTSSTSECGIFVFDFASGTLLVSIINAHSSRIESVAITPDNTKIISGSNTGEIRIRNITNLSQVGVSMIHGGTACNTLIISPDGTKIVSGTSDHNVKVWDINTQQLLHTTYLTEPPDSSITNGTLHSDGTLMISSSSGIVFFLQDYFNKISETTRAIPGAKFYQNLTNYLLTVQPGTSSFNIPQYYACHIKVCKISNMEIYFFVNMTPNTN